MFCEERDDVDEGSDGGESVVVLVVVVRELKNEEMNDNSDNKNE